MTRAKSAISLGVSALIVIALIIVVGFGAYLNATLNTTNTSNVTTLSPVTTSISQTPATSTITTSIATVCSISGQPAGLELRILSDTSKTPISGAEVKATNQPALCDNTPATKQATVTFTTSDTEWYSLPSDNNAGYSFTVSYSGQDYNFTATLRPVSITCATLFIPSDKTNVTINEFQTTCTDSSITNTSVSNTAAQINFSSSSSPCDSTTCSEAFYPFQTIPSNSFTVGNYGFKMVYNGTGYEGKANGTGYMDMGFAFVFNVTSIGSSAASTLVFNWLSPCNMNYGLPCEQNNSLVVPSPSTQTAFDSHVKMMWYTNTTGLYLGIWAADTAVSTSASSTNSNLTCTAMNTGNQTSVTETYLCHSESTITSNSSSSG